MKRTQHAREIASRFKELVEDAGDTLAEQHYNELALLIEAGIDTAVVETLENIAGQLDKLAQDVRHNAEHFV